MISLKFHEKQRIKLPSRSKNRKEKYYDHKSEIILRLMQSFSDNV